MSLEYKPSEVLQKQPIARFVIDSLVDKRVEELEDPSRDTPVSVVVRGYNEGPMLRRLLKSIGQQLYSQSVEIVYVDNESTDDSRDIADDFGAKIITIGRSEFTYPKALNFGIQNSSNEIVALTVAHALPTSNIWLRAGVQHFNDPKVAGVFGIHASDEKSKTYEKIRRDFTIPLWVSIGTSVVSDSRINRAGIFGATNAIMRRSLWKKHKFDESYEIGGEDSEWARWAHGRGYDIIFDPLFAIHHTHGLNYIQKKREVLYHRKMARGPRTMDHLGSYAKARYDRK